MHNATRGRPFFFPSHKPTEGGLASCSLSGSSQRAKRSTEVAKLSTLLLEKKRVLCLCFAAVSDGV